MTFDVSFVVGVELTIRLNNIHSSIEKAESTYILYDLQKLNSNSPSKTIKKVFNRLSR